MSDSYYNGQPDDESRQQYANARHRELLERQPLTWEESLQAFRVFGQMYDQGFRLRDLERAA